MLELIILLALVFYVGYRIGLITAARRVALNLVDDPERMRKLFAELARLRAEEAALESGELPVSKEIEVHKEGEQYYLYRKSNNEFLAQGPTLKDALEAVGKRFPKETFAGTIPKEQVDAWGLSNKN